MGHPAMLAHVSRQQMFNPALRSYTQVMCMAPPTAAGEEPMALQNTGRFSLSLSSGRSVGTTRRQTSKQKPLYKWELPVEEREALEASMRSTHVTTEHGDFRPGRRMGHVQVYTASMGRSSGRFKSGLLPKGCFILEMTCVRVSMINLTACQASIRGTSTGSGMTRRSTGAMTVPLPARPSPSWTFKSCSQVSTPLPSRLSPLQGTALSIDGTHPARALT
jgi:hypothetical protein